MDNRILFISLIFIAICALPFILSYRERLRQQKAFLASLSELAGRNSCSLTSSDVCNNTAIGMDAQRRELFVLRRKHDSLESSHVKLIEYSRCSLVRSGQDQLSGGEYTGELKRLELSFFKDKSHKPDLCIEIFDLATDMIHSGELELAVKWEKILSGS